MAAGREHLAIILFGIFDEARVLFGEEEIICGNTSVVACIIGCATLQFMELVDHFAFAGLRQAEACGVAISLRVLAKLIEAGITITRSLGSCRINLV